MEGPSLVGPCRTFGFEQRVPRAGSADSLVRSNRRLVFNARTRLSALRCDERLRCFRPCYGRAHEITALIFVPHAGQAKQVLPSGRKRKPESLRSFPSFLYVIRNPSKVTSSRKPQLGHSRSSRSSVKSPKAAACSLICTNCRARAHRPSTEGGVSNPPLGGQECPPSVARSFALALTPCRPSFSAPISPWAVA